MKTIFISNHGLSLSQKDQQKFRKSVIQFNIALAREVIQEYENELYKLFYFIMKISYHVSYVCQFLCYVEYCEG